MKKLYFLLTISFLLSISLKKTNSQVNVQDSLALVDLYNSTNGPGWYYNWNWLNGNVNSWHGVSVENNRVVNLDLHGAGLNGTLPSSIGNLTMLNYLSLYSNNLSGPIPSSIGNLVNLKTCNLFFNQFSGEIPASIGNLINLTILNLSYNSVTGSIPPSIGSLTNLEVLYLYSNQLNGVIPSEIGNLRSLQSLDLMENYLSGSIPSTIGNLSNLTTLYLTYNQLEGAIPSTIGNLKALTRLEAYNNQLSGVIPTSIDGLISLEYLDLSSNQLSGEIPASIGNLTNLESLYLRSNQLSGVIPSTIGNMTNLTDLSLGNNQLSGTIPSTIGDLTNLTKLALSNNHLSGEIPATIGNLTNLIFLHLGYNQLNGEIPTTIGDLTKLIYFDLYHNQMSGAIPATIGNLINLTSLDFYSNQLSGAIPTSIGNLTNVTKIHLNSNQLSGEIPTSIGNLTNLTELYLYNNQLSGVIPATIGNLTKLKYLNLSTNQLNGAVPSSISKLSELKYFYVYSNKLTGLPVLPSSITNGVVSNNYFSFDDILPNKSALVNYSPQYKTGGSRITTLNNCDTFTFNLGIDSSLTTNIYKWYKNGQLLTTTNSNKFEIPGVASANAGAYTCVVTNPGAPSLTLTSNPDTLVVTGVTIASQPTDQTACDGNTTTFNIKTPRKDLTYQWQQSSDGGTSWTDITGANDTILSVNATGAENNFKYRCSVSAGCGTPVISAAALLTVHPLPVIASSTPSDTICEGTALALNVSATDTSGATLTYQWQKYVPNQWENIDGQTSTVLNLTAQPEINKSYYRCVVTGLCSSNSEPAQISVTNAPAIVTQPADFSVCQGAMAGFSVNATGLDSTYQWQYSADNGSSWNDIAGANHFYFETDGTSSVNGNLYRCLVSGSCGNSATSNAARLTLIDNPALTSQPVAQSVVEGDQASFAVSATGTNLTYQWQNNLSGNWTDIQEATESTLNFSASLSNAADYRCMVNSLCASNPASLIVAAKPNITKQPVDQTVVEGTTATFNVVASGYDLAYQWQKYEGGTWNNVQTATSKVYKVQALPAQEGEYRCVITNLDNVTVNSSSAWLRRCTTPTIETQPLNQTVCEGSDVTFSVSALEPSGFQWQVKTNGSNVWGNIPLATDAGYSFTVQAASNGNAYRCLVTRTCGSSATSETAVLTSGNTVITKQPSGLALCDGDQARFSVHASGLNISYQWQQFGTTWNNITGATDSTYTTTVNTSSHRKQFRCVVTGTCGTRTSNNALLTRGPQVINTLADQTSCNGGTATFGNIIAKGSGILNYQWQKSTNQGQTWTNITGANATSYPMAVTNADNGNVYRCIVSGICGTADTSNFAALVLKNTQIESQPLNATICEGNPTELGVKVSGLDLSYQWSQSANGTSWADIDGAVDDSLHLPVTNSMNGYKFICKVKGRCDVNWISSGIASLATIANTLSQPEVTVAPVTCEGGENNGAITTVTPTGGQSPYSYKWSNGATTQNLTALPVGQYTLTVNDINGCRRSVSKTVAYDAPFSENIAVTDVSIPGTAGGTIDPGITGGHQPLTYQWSNGFTDSIARGLVAGNYSLTVTDNANCTKTFSAIVNEQAAIAYMDTSNLPDPETRQLDKTLSVGTIAGEAGVSPSGAATYTIPIETLPGVGGMVPQLSLVYNSQAGNGIMGWGWNLGGLSAVTRTPHTIYHNNTARGLRLDKNDGLVLDGNRLILKDGNYGEDQSHYGTENETFTTITANGDFGGAGPAWFEVKAKNGTRYIYGKSEGSKLKYNEDAILTWNLDTVIDMYGNYMAYKYQQDGLVSYLTKISYGGNRNAGTDCNNTIELLYANRTDQIPVHYGLESDNIKVVLEKVIVKNQTNLYREYSLNYVKDDFSRLLEIWLNNGNKEKKNATVFKWGKYKTSPILSMNAELMNDPAIEISKQGYVNADINGDGLTDLISFYENSGNKARVYYASNNAEGKVEFTMGEVLTLGKDLSSTRRGFHSRMGTSNFGDLDGDNKTEVVISEWNNYSGSAVKFNIYFNNDVHNGPPSQRPLSTKLLVSSEVPVYAMADINNDGYDEIVFVERGTKDGNNYPGKIYLPRNKSWVNFNVYQSTVKPERMFSSDFDGDGMQDIVILDSKGYRIYKNHGGSEASSFVQSAGYKTEFTSESGIHLGDFNGDGLPDFVIRSLKGSTIWKLLINNGALGFRQIPLQIQNSDDPDTGKDDDKDNCLVTDFDNDGKSDILVMDAHYKWKHNWGSSWKEFEKFLTYWYKSTGEGFELVNSSQSNDEADAYSKRFATGDFNGDGRYDLVNYGYDCNGTDKTRRWRMYSVPDTSKEKGLITSIVNGLNQIAKFHYLPLTDSSVYKKSDFKYPLTSFTAPIYVVDMFGSDNGLNGYNTLSCTYGDAMIHKQGKGFMGFAKTKQKNNVTNTTAVSKAEFDNTYFTVYKQTSETFLGIDTLSVSYNYFKTVPVSGKRVFVHPDQTVTRDLRKNIHVKTVNNYDGNGNLTKQTSWVNTDYYTSEKSQDNFNSFGAPGTVVSKATRQGEPAFTQTQTYTYNDKGSLETATANNITSTYGYDMFGNMDSTAAGPDARTSTLSYSPDGRFAVTRTNALDHTGIVNYDFAGNPILSIDINGVPTTSKFNGWGSLTESTTPDNRIIKQTIDWVTENDNDSPSDALFSSKNFTDLLLTGADYYDKLGRTIRKVTIGFNGAKFYTDTKYNSKGQVTEVTDPYPSGSYSGKKIVFTYDDLGRVYTETYANGVVKTYNYDDAANKVSTTFSTGESYTKTYDPAGQVIEAADPGGTITYKYNSANKPVQILSPGSKTEIKYDDFGRQDTLIEPNAGTIAYTYNPYGELASQTNANGQTTTMQYDKLGRVLKKTVGSITTDYAYDRGTRALGTTSSISRSDGARESYSYSNDGLCRLISQTRSNGTDSFAYAYNYYTKGRLQKLTYPAGFAINYTYTDYDEVLELRKSDGRLIWKLDETNPANGQMQKATYGNGQQTTYSYDSEDRLTRIYVPGIIDFNYQFNNKQQLDWREEKYYIADSSKWKGFKENFGYDAVNRLDTVTGEAAGLTIAYSGNHILSKSDVGTYAYQNGNHRIDELTAVAGHVPREHHLTYTAEGKVDTLTELTDSTTVKKLAFGYGLDNQRFSMKYLVNDTLKYTRYYEGNYEKEVKADGTVRHLNYIYAGNGLIAIFEQESGSDTTHYVYTDYLGSLRCITDSIGSTKQTFGFDAWGNRRNSITGTHLLSFGGTGGGFSRGYTGHENLDEVGLINMNGRVYDPRLGMFISVDNYVQQPDNTQNFNRYSYCLNNPLMYTDPSGEKWWHWGIADILTGGAISLTVSTTGLTAYGAAFPVTDQCYELQKYVSPIAFKPTFGFGSLQNGIGFDVSVGMLKGSNGYRFNYGTTYYWSNYGGYNGWETRWGGEWELLPLINYSGTKFSAGGFSQTTGKFSIGDPFTNIKYENDMMFGFKMPGVPEADGGDRFRTAAVGMNFGVMSINLNMFTGDPGLSQDMRETELIDGWKTYSSGTSNDSKYRVGALSVGFGPLRIGRNSEGIRNTFQNELIHKNLNPPSPLFKVLDIAPSWYWYFGFGSGNTLW